MLRQEQCANILWSIPWTILSDLLTPGGFIFFSFFLLGPKAPNLSQLKAQHWGWRTPVPGGEEQRENCCRAARASLCDLKGKALPDFFFLPWLVGSQPGRASCRQAISRPAALLLSPHPQSCRQMLQHGAGSVPTCKEDGARLQQLDAKGNSPQRGGDKMQGPGNLFSVQAGRKNWEGIRGVPKEMHVRNLLWFLVLCFGQRAGEGGGVLVAFISPAHGRIPEFFKVSRMLACDGSTEQIVLKGKRRVSLSFWGLLLLMPELQGGNSRTALPGPLANEPNSDHVSLIQLLRKTTSSLADGGESWLVAWLHLTRVLSTVMST